MKKIFTLLLVVISMSSFSQTNYYVNDTYNTLTDVFTTAAGNDLNAGTAAAPFATLNKAISVAVAGNFIYVDAGTYITGGDINKSLTIRGANYLISPNDAVDPLIPNGSRNAETIISNTSWNIGANNINITGMTFDPQSNIAIKQTNTALDFDNINISKNIFRNKSDNKAIQIYGKFQLPLVTFDCFITDNRFIKEVSNSNTAIIVSGINNVQVLNNTFTVSTDFANRTQSAMSFGTGTSFNYRVDNLLVSNNTAYRQFLFFNGRDALNTRIDFNKAIECQRFAFANNTLNEPCIVDISDNIVTDPKGGQPSIGYQKINGTDLSSPNIARIERNTVTVNGTGSINIPTALITANLDDATQNSQVYIRDNKLSFSGSFSTLTDNSGLFIAGIRFLNNSRQAVVERNEIEFTATNYNATNKCGIYIAHYNLQPGTNFDILNNKVSGFPTSLAIQLNDPFSAGVGAFGQLPDWAIVNAHNNSFTNDVLSINNGTQSQTVNASCNWFGSAAAQDFIGKLTLPTIELLPWLTNGTDNSAATGFQPIPNSCDGYPTLITLDGYTDVTCNGANNGTINITATYGKAPTVFTWTKDEDAGFVSHEEDLTNLSPGIYHLAITDGNGSNIYMTDQNADGPGTIDIEITEPPVLSASSSGTNNLCFGQSNGTASVIVSGGTEPYSYIWSNSETTDAIENLVAGNYSVTVTDANGCQTNSSVEITQPTLLTASITNNSTACSNIATAGAGGGTTVYSYLWSNGATTAAISSVPVGTYTVTVTDANGCQATSIIILSVGEAFNPSASVTDVTCYGANNGIITVTNANGTAPFDISIDGINYTIGVNLPYSINNLPAGPYTVYVRDANGCTGFVTKTIAQPPLLSATINSVQNSCYGENTGAISINVTGGTGALSYSWSGPGGFTSSQKNINGLAAGSFALTVTDNSGCTAVLNVVVPSYDQINVNGNIANVSCKSGTNGSIALNVTGGTGNFSYIWNNGANTSSISNLGAATYNVIVTDIGSGCGLDRIYYTISEPNALTFTTAKPVVQVSGCNTLGSITVNAVSGGVAPYQFSRDGINFQPGSVPYTFNNLVAGDYNVTVRDANGCIKSTAIPLTIGDNGSDEYEKCVPGKQNNNNKNNACTITTGTPILARIGTASDVDWFKVSITNAGNYTITLSHPSASIIYAISAAAGTPAPVLAGNTATLGIGTYYITVSGATVSDLSLTCYQLTVSTGSPLKSTGNNLQMEIVNKKIGKDIFDVKVLGNPSHSGFVLNVISSSDENISLKIMDISGRLIENRSNLSVGKTLQVGDRYIKGIYLAEIIQGRKRKVVKLVKL